MKYLILGSSGQIGHSLIQWCDQNALSYIEFDLVRDSAEDLRTEDNDRLKTAVADADFVMFLAYDVGGSRYLKGKQDQFEFISNNARLMEYTFCVLKESKKPFIFVSSQMANLSFSPYGALKAVGEHYARALGGIVVKLWNVYGIETDMEKSHVITDFIRKASETGVIDMITDGTESRQFLHAEDCSRCLITLAEQYGSIPRDKELHIASGEWHTILEVAEIISGLFPGTKIQPADCKDDVQKNSLIDPDPYIRGIWDPKISLKTGIEQIKKDKEVEN